MKTHTDADAHYRLGYADGKAGRKSAADKQGKFATRYRCGFVVGQYEAEKAKAAQKRQEVAQ